MEKWEKTTHGQHTRKFAIPCNWYGSFTCCILGCHRTLHDWRWCNAACCCPAWNCWNNSFIRGIARLLSIVAASNKRKATNGLYVFTLRQLHENVVYKYISISVASILMMLTIMFIANGSATIMSHGNELTRTSAVYDFTVMGEEQNVEQYLSDDQMRVYVANLNRMETGNMKRPASGEMKSFVDWSVLRKEIVQNLPEGVIDPATQEAASYEFGSHQPAALNLLGFIDTGSVSPYMLPVSSYNRLLEAAGEKQINLENDEAVFTSTRTF